eukprot:5087414-Prymnesium_polylepis.1
MSLSGECVVYCRQLSRMFCMSVGVRCQSRASTLFSTLPSVCTPLRGDVGGGPQCTAAGGVHRKYGT